MYGQASIAGHKSLPECPDELMHVWRWFVELRNAAPHAVPVSFAEIAAYFGLTGYIATPYEVGLIRGLDQEWLAEAARKAERASKGGSPRRQSLISHG
jgi:hypothetical protein